MPSRKRPKGAKTKTWVTIKGQPITAWAGLWRDSDEWGPVYSGAMTDCNDAMRPLHERMPVLLLPDEFDQWLHGSFDELVALQRRSFPNELIEIESNSGAVGAQKASRTRRRRRR